MTATLRRFAIEENSVDEEWKWKKRDDASIFGDSGKLKIQLGSWRFGKEGIFR